MEPRKYDVFISYRRTAYDTANLIAEKLRHTGIKKSGVRILNLNQVVMRYSRFAILISVIMSCLCIYGQTQQGYVKTKGRLGNNGTVIAGTRLQGATVTVKGGNAVVSGSNGTFSLALPTSSYYLQSVQKQGYVLTDPDVLSKQYAYSKNPLVLVLETPDQQSDDRLAAERKIRRTLQKQLQDKEDEIEALKEQQELSDEEYRKQLQEIYAQQESNEKLIGEMAERYSKMDFDEVDEFNRRISSLILEGKLTEADSLLNTKGDINSRAAALRQHQEANVQAEQELKKKQKKLERSKAMTQKELEDLAQDCYSKFEIFKMQHQNDSAAYYLEIRAELDTMNISWALDVSNFVAEYLGDYKKAIKKDSCAMQIAISYYGSSHIYTADCYSHLGQMYNEIGNYKEAIDYLTKGLVIYSEDTISYKGLSKIFNDLAVVYDNIREFDRSLAYHKKSIEVKKKLYNEENDVIAMSYSDIGYVYSELRQFDSAIDYYHKALAILENTNYNESLDAGIVLMNIGGVYWAQGDYNRAQEYFTKSQGILINVLGSQHPRVATGLSNLASLFYVQKNYSKALEYNKKALNILEPALGENHVQVATIYSNIGGIYEEIQDYEKAIENTIASLNRYSALYGEGSQGSIYAAVQYRQLGRIHNKTENYDQAEYCYKKAVNIEKNIFSSPNIYLFNAYRGLAEFYTEHHRYVNAKDVYVEMLDITRALYGDGSEEMINNWGNIYFSLLSEYNQTQSTHALDDYNEFMSTHIITGVVNDNSPASRQGMKGTYYILSINDWDFTMPSSMIEKVMSLQGKPKNIVVMKDGVISEYKFNDSMGIRTGFEEITKEEREHILHAYRKWTKAK